jgi:hypothetical protein
MVTSLPRALKGFLLGWVFLVAAGCSSGSTVSGTVTIDGEPLKDGTITLIPKDPKTGQAAGGDIKNGFFKIKNVTPGEMRVTVNIKLDVSPGEMMAKGAEIRKQQHVAAAKGSRPPPIPGLAGPRLHGNDEIYDIGRGTVVLDIKLTKVEETQKK